MKDWREVISEEEIMKLVEKTTDAWAEARMVLHGYAHQHLAVPQVALIGDLGMHNLSEMAKASLIRSLSGEELEEVQDDLAGATEAILMICYLAGYNLGLLGKPLIKIKGLCEHDHSDN